MTDLLAPRMPDDLHHALFVARVELLHEAQDINVWLEAFFEETWAECHRTHTVPTFKMVKGERVDFTVEVDGTPHFNEFDRRANRYADFIKRVSTYVEADTIPEARRIAEQAALDMDVMDAPGSDFDRQEVAVARHPRELRVVAAEDEESPVWRSGEKWALCDSAGERAEELATPKAGDAE